MTLICSIMWPVAVGSRLAAKGWIFEDIMEINGIALNEFPLVQVVPNALFLQFYLHRYLHHINQVSYISDITHITDFYSLNAEDSDRWYRTRGMSLHYQDVHYCTPSDRRYTSQRDHLESVNISFRSKVSYIFQWMIFIYSHIEYSKKLQCFEGKF